MKKKLSPLLSAAILIVIGVILVLYAGEGVAKILRIIGVGLLLVGAVGIAGYVWGKDEEKKDLWKLMIAVLEVIAGIALLANPKAILAIYPIVVGVIIILNGLGNLISALSMRQKGDEHWKAMLIVAIITIVLGMVVVLNPFATADMLTTVIGVILIYDGITSILPSFKKEKSE